MALSGGDGELDAQCPESQAVSFHRVLAACVLGVSGL